MAFSILVINPGSTSTKLALFEDEHCRHEATLDHDPALVAGRRQVVEQLGMRQEALRGFLRELGDLRLDAICGRGGPLRPLTGGTYRVDETMLADLRSARYGEHASLLGGLLAHGLARDRGLPAFVVDPISVDELSDRARVSGVPQIQRSGRSHALSIKAVTRLAAGELDRELEATRFVVAHMGGGISVAALDSGRIADVNDALLGMGPFSPYRAGALPLRGVLDLAFAPGAERAEIEQLLAARSGLYAYLGTGDLREVEERIAAGDEEAAGIFEAMVYQIAKEIGAMAAALSGRIDGIILTGGMSRSERLVELLRHYVGDFGRIFLYPGEKEMEALAGGALRVLKGTEVPLQYGRQS